VCSQGLSKTVADVTLGNADLGGLLPSIELMVMSGSCGFVVSSIEEAGCRVARGDRSQLSFSA
jgi:hypothetical protein